MSDRAYKIRMPVMHRVCLHCRLDFIQHVDGKCLFDSTDFKPGGVKVTKQTVKANISTTDFCCGRTQVNACAKCGRDFNA